MEGDPPPPPEQQDALILSDWHRLPYNEIAHVQGVSTARASLREKPRCAGHHDETLNRTPAVAFAPMNPRQVYCGRAVLGWEARSSSRTGGGL